MTAMLLKIKINPYVLNKIIKYRFFSSTGVIGLNHLSKFCEKLENRSVLEVCGDESPAFLQGLITNDIHHLTNGNKSSVHLPCIYSMMLNTQGRLLYDIFLYKDKENPHSKFFLECDNRICENIIKHLKIYRVRKKIDISVSDGLDVWSLFKDSTTSKDFIENFAKYRDVLITKDPRIHSLGYRIIAPKDFDVPKISNLPKVEGKYKQHIYKIGVGEGIDNHPPGNCFPLECNGDYLNGVSFFKGCYIGQELTSRVHHTGVVRKRILPFTSNQTFEKMDNVTAEIQNELGKNVGKVRGFVGSVGIGLMRVTEVFASKSLFLKWNNDKIDIVVEKPGWWPTEVPK